MEASSQLRWPLYETMVEKTPGSRQTKQKMMEVIKFPRLTLDQISMEIAEGGEETQEHHIHRPDRPHVDGTPRSLPC